eukprot:6212565-Pleurochrysis_carterae.AAC.1
MDGRKSTHWIAKKFSPLDSYTTPSAQFQIHFDLRVCAHLKGEKEMQDSDRVTSKMSSRMIQTWNHETCSRMCFSQNLASEPSRAALATESHGPWLLFGLMSNEADGARAADAADHVLPKVCCRCCTTS